VAMRAPRDGLNPLEVLTPNRVKSPGGCPVFLAIAPTLTAAHQGQVSAQSLTPHGVLQQILPMHSKSVTQPKGTPE
jgi:hypothetical protein